MNRYRLAVKIKQSDGGTSTEILWINYPNFYQWLSYSPYIGLSFQGNWKYQAPITDAGDVWLYDLVEGSDKKIILLARFDPIIPNYGTNVGSNGWGFMNYAPIPVVNRDIEWEVLEGDHYEA